MIRLQILFFHDATERPIQRPKDVEAQKAYYSGKKKQHTIKNNLMITADSKVVFLTPSFEGRIHDKRIADRIGYSPPRGSILYQEEVLECRKNSDSAFVLFAESRIFFEFGVVCLDGFMCRFDVDIWHLFSSYVIGIQNNAKLYID